MFDPFGIVAKAGRELPQEGDQLFAQVEDAGGEHIRQWPFDVAQAPDMGDVAVALVAEDESRRRRLVPGGITFGPLQRVKRTV